MKKLTHCQQKILRL